MSVSISHPTDRPNFSVVQLGRLVVIFSYSTPIGFSVGGEAWTLSENLWGQTTGKHLNYFGAESRIEREKFEALLTQVLKDHSLVPA